MGQEQVTCSNCILAALSWNDSPKAIQRAKYNTDSAIFAKM